MISSQMWALIDHAAVIALIAVSLAQFLRGFWSKRQSCARCPLASSQSGSQRPRPRLRLYQPATRL